ncbi:MAG: phosphatase PAP2 family protein [Romboutsia sp.]
MDIQLSILQFFQSIGSPFLNIIFLIFTISTELPILVLFTAGMYWCINKKYGQKILFSLVGNIALNTGIKEFVRAPRPIGLEGINSMHTATATGYSFPSGHTQSATTFWISLMLIFKRSWIYIVGTIMILGVGISRLYLGVHWPIDVVFGWIIAIIFTVFLGKVFDYIDENKNYNILLLILVPFIIVAFLLKSTEYIKMMGLFTGFIIGYIVEDKFIQFETENNKNKINFKSKRKNKSRMIINLYRFLIGIVTLGLVYVGLKYIMPTGYMFDYIRYAVVVFYGIAGAPALFKIFKLN